MDARQDIDAPSWDSLPELLTVRETSALLRVSQNSVYEAVASGTLRHIVYRWGRSIRIPKQALRRLVEGGRPDG